MGRQSIKVIGKSTGIAWLKLVGKWGRATRIRTSRFDDITDQAIERVAARDGINGSMVIYTGVRRLEVVRKEIASIKRERRGERDHDRRAS